MIQEIRNGVRHYPDGRQVCLETAEGKREYKRRRAVALEAQGGLCALCGQYLDPEEATTDHLRPRGMGGAHRDDSQDAIQAAHGRCNTDRGSRRL